MNWDYELARAMRPQKQGPPGLEGRVVSTAPLTISLLNGEVMAPPAALAVVEGAPGYTVSEHAIQRLPWRVGDRAACIWMGKSLVVLGRLEEPCRVFIRSCPRPSPPRRRRRWAGSRPLTRTRAGFCCGTGLWWSAAAGRR